MADSPFITAGLTGKVYLINDGVDLPDLSIFFTGAINLRVDASNTVTNGHLVTTFDALPQLPLSAFTVHITAGTSPKTGLLKISPCRSGNQSPLDGPINYQYTSWADQGVNSDVTVEFARCVGMVIKKPVNCIDGNRLVTKPTYETRASMKKAYLYINGKRFAQVKKSPFAFNADISTVGKGKNQRLSIESYYDGTRRQGKDTTSFQRCK